MQLLSYLIRAGSDVNLQDNDGGAVLHEVRSPEVTEFFLANGADVNVLDGKGRTPLDCANINGFDDIALLLQEHGAVPSESMISNDD